MQKRTKNSKRKYWIDLFVILLILSNCSTQGTLPKSDYLIIDLSEPLKMNIFYASSLIEECRYIPLETTKESVTGDIRTLIPVQEGFFTLDRFQQLNYFDLNGKFIHRIGARGRGPGEFTNLVNFSLSEKDKILYLHDSNNQILVYTFDNEFLGSIRLERFVTKVLKTAWGFICYHDPQMTFGEETAVLVTLDNDGNRLNTLQYRKVDNRQLAPFVYPTELINVNDKYYYYPPFQDTLYSVHIDKIVPEFVFPKGRFSISYEEMATLDRSRAARARGLTLGGFVIDKDLIFFAGYRQNKPEMYLYDFVSDKLISFSEIVNDIDNSYSFFPRWIYQNQWIEIRNADNILEETVVLPEALQNLKPEDNPVIRISKFKK